MKRLLVTYALFLLDGLAVARNVVVVGCVYVSRYFDPVIPITLTEPAPERRHLQQGYMPMQPAPTARVTRTGRDQRPMLRMFTTARNDLAY